MLFSCVISYFSVSSWSNGEVVGHLHLESGTAAEVDHSMNEDGMRAGWQRAQHDRVTVGDPGLWRAGHARIKSHEGGIGCEREQPRCRAVTEQIVQGLSVHNNFELRHEIDNRRGPF